MTEAGLQFCLDSGGGESIYLVYFLELRILGPVLPCGALAWGQGEQPSGLVGRGPGFQPGSLAPGAREGRDC